MTLCRESLQETSAGFVRAQTLLECTHALCLY